MHRPRGAVIPGPSRLRRRFLGKRPGLGEWRQPRLDFPQNCLPHITGTRTYNDPQTRPTVAELPPLARERDYCLLQPRTCVSPYYLHRNPEYRNPDRSGPPSPGVSQRAHSSPPILPPCEPNFAARPLDVGSSQSPIAHPSQHLQSPHCCPGKARPHPDLPVPLLPNPVQRPTAPSTG